MRDNAWEVNERLRTVPTCFHKAVEDSIQQGAASALAAIDAHFFPLVDVWEMRGMSEGNDDHATELLMPQLEGAIDAIFAIILLDEVLQGPSSECEG